VPEAAGAATSSATGAGSEALEITLRTSDDPARVRLNGEDLADGTPLVLRIEPGRPYAVSVEKDGYQAVSWSFSLDALSAEQRNAQELYFPLRQLVPEGEAPAAVAEPLEVPELPLGPVDPMRLPNDGVRPVAIDQTEPQLPDWAAQQGLPSYVVVELVIDAAGRVREAQVLGDGIHPDLDRLAVDAVRQWRFEPARVDGKPVAVYHNLAVVFRRDR
jgi:TonB family protein